jgi:hypothetical protein
MSSPIATATPAKAAASPPAVRKPVNPMKPVNPGEGRSPEAKRTAAAVLEVLAGTRTTTQAASALGVSLPRYYVLEARALAGLVAGCEPRPKGRTLTPQRELAALQKECDRLRREASRQQALARAAGRTVGLSLPEKPKPQPAAGKRRNRRPTARALLAARHLRTDGVASPPTNGAAKPEGAASVEKV